MKKFQPYFFFLLTLAALGACQSPPVQLPSILVASSTIRVDYVDLDTVHLLHVDTTTYRPSIIDQAWYTTWHGSKLEQTQGYYQGRLLHGPYQKSLRNGRLLQRGEYRWRLPHAEWRYWYADGTLQAIETWNDGLRDGAASYYNEVGKALAKGKYHKGQRHGKWEERQADGTWQVVKYDAGEIVVEEKETAEEEIETATTGTTEG